MRFTHINHRYAPFQGGSERYLEEISRGMAAEGHSVTVVTSNAFDLEYFWDGRRRSISAQERERDEGVDIVRTPVAHFPGSSTLFRGTHRVMGEASRFLRVAKPFEMVATRMPR